MPFSHSKVQLKICKLTQYCLSFLSDHVQTKSCSLQQLGILISRNGNIFKPLNLQQNRFQNCVAFLEYKIWLKISCELSAGWQTIHRTCEV